MTAVMPSALLPVTLADVEHFLQAGTGQVLCPHRLTGSSQQPTEGGTFTATIL